MELPWTHLVVLVWALGLAFWDGRYRRLPNLATWGAMAVGVFWIILMGRGFLGGTASAAFLGLLLGFFVLLPAYAFRLVGAGDVKFLMAIGMLGGATLVVQSYLLGMAFALVPALFVWVRTQQKPRKVPLGLGFGLACAVCVVWPHLLPASL